MEWDTHHRKKVRKKAGTLDLLGKKDALRETIRGWFPNFTPDFPLHLQDDFYDIGILGAEIDRPTIKKLKTLLTKTIKNANGEPVDVVTIERNAAHTSRDFRLEEILKRATLYFLFVSDDFLECSWARLVKSEAIEKTLADNRSCVIPVYSDRKQRNVFGLNGIRGINLLDLLKGKSIEEVDLDQISRADLRANIVSGIEKVIGRHSYIKTKRRLELEQERKIYVEKEKLRIIQETLNNTPDTPREREHHLRSLGLILENQPRRSGDMLEVTLADGMKVYVPVTQVRRRAVVDETGEPLDFDNHRRPPSDTSRVRADSSGSGSSFEELSLNEMDIA